jgi:thiamine biosynthesis lipoprotein
MGGVASIVAVGDDAACLAAAVARAEVTLRDMHHRWTRFDPCSELMLLNGAGGRPVTVSTATIELVEAMRSAFIRTDGVVDASVFGRVMEAGYTVSATDPRVPSVTPESFERGDVAAIDIDAAASVVALPEGLWLDAGGFGKGLAADRVVAQLMACGTAGALVAIDGEVRVLGAAPAPHGWVVDVEDPRTHRTSPSRPSRPLARIALTDGGVATSSTRRHRWERAGVVHHHLVGPDALRIPVRDVPATASVVTTSAVEAEVLAKLPLLLGEGDGVEQILRLDASAAVLVVRADDSVATYGSWPMREEEAA